MKYVFVTVNYNGYSHTETFIKSVNEIIIEDSDTIEIIVVDNCSVKEDLDKHEELISKKKNVTLLKSEENLGYFGGMNVGLDAIEYKKEKIILICNNDLTFSNDFLVNYKKVEYASDIFLIAPNITTKEGKQQNPLLIGKLNKLAILKADIYTSNYYIGTLSKLIFSSLNKFRKEKVALTNGYGQMIIGQGIGACYILTENFLDTFDSLDNKVFLWGEETILRNQIEQHGGKTLYCPTLKIVHHESASVSKIQSRKKYDILRKSYKVYRKYL